MKGLFNQLSYLGVREEFSALETRRIVLVNQSSLLGMVMCLALMFFYLFVGKTAYAIGDVGFFLIFIPVLVLHRAGKYKIARSIFSVFVLLGSCTFVLFYLLENSHSTGPEYSFYAIALLLLFLYDAPMQQVYYLSCLVALSVLEYVKVILLWDAGFSELVYGLINQLVIWLVLYILVKQFKHQSETALAKVQDLLGVVTERNEELDQQHQMLQRASRQSAENEVVLRALIDHQPTLIMLLTPEGEVMEVNRVSFFEFLFSQEPTKGLHFEKALVVSLGNLLKGLVEKARRGIVSDFEQEHRKTNGSIAKLLGEVRPVYKTAEELLGVSIILRDETAVWEEHKQIELLREKREQMLALITHELKAPLQSLHQILDDDMPAFLKEPSLLAKSREVKNQLSKSSLSIENLVLWLQAQNPAFSLVPVPILLKDLVAQSVVSYREVASNRGIDFDLEMRDDLMVRVNKRSLILVLLNVLDNAIKFAKANSLIVVRSWQEGAKVYITINDTGKGISAETVGKWNEVLADPMEVWGDNEMDNLKIGLRLSAFLMQCFEGTIRLESQEGIGTSVMLTLPCA